jgi:hypothetical protein
MNPELGNLIIVTVNVNYHNIMKVYNHIIVFN